MSLQLNQHVKMTGGADFDALVSGRELSEVIFWDIGPAKPEPPKRPKSPVGKEGDPEYDLAVLEFRDQALPKYEDDLRAYGKAKTDYEAWQEKWGGPYEFTQWSVDASDTLERDQRAVTEGRQPRLHYYISSRTRGYGHLKNHGLPAGMKPGRGHEENMRRKREADADLVAAGRKDPVFGEQELRQ